MCKHFNDYLPYLVMKAVSEGNVVRGKKIPLRLCVLCCFNTPVTECSGACINCEAHVCEDCMESDHEGLIFCSIYCAHGGIIDTPDSLCLYSN